MYEVYLGRYNCIVCVSAFGIYYKLIRCGRMRMKLNLITESGFAPLTANTRNSQPAELASSYIYLGIFGEYT
jgi:hypothetical protein